MYPNYMKDTKKACLPDSPVDPDTVCEFECDPGYDLIGSSQVTCLADGQLSNDLPVCRGIECGVYYILIDIDHYLPISPPPKKKKKKKKYIYIYIKK